MEIVIVGVFASDTKSGQGAFMLIVWILGFVFWYYVIKGGLAIFRRTPENVRDALKQKGTSLLLQWISKIFK